MFGKLLSTVHFSESSKLEFPNQGSLLQLAFSYTSTLLLQGDLPLFALQ